MISRADNIAVKAFEHENWFLISKNAWNEIKDIKISTDTDFTLKDAWMLFCRENKGTIWTDKRTESLVPYGQILRSYVLNEIPSILARLKKEAEHV